MSSSDETGAAERKRKIAGAFSRAAGGYDDIAPFHSYGARLASLADIQRGHRVLDVATGRGANLFPAVEAAGPTGQVLGIDLAQGMARATAAECERRQLSQAGLAVMDAEALAFPDGCFDRVLCGFAICFFPHAHRALAELWRVLTPGGRLGLSTWGEEDQRWNWLGDTIRPYLDPRPEPSTDETDDAGPDFQTPAGLQAFLSEAGFTVIQIVTDEEEYYCESPEQWWDELWKHGARIVMEEIGERGGQEALDRFKAEVFARMAALKQPRGYPERQTVHFTIATK